MRVQATVMSTPRTLLRPLNLGDAPAIQQIFPQWEIVKFMRSKIPWPYPIDGALVYLRDALLPKMASGDAWAWSIRLKEDPDELIGTIALHLGETNRGFWLDPRWQRRGLMTEAADAVTDFWFHTLEQPVLRAPKAVPNVGSRTISERQGMRLGGADVDQFVAGTLPVEVWETTRVEWMARRP